MLDTNLPQKKNRAISVAEYASGCLFGMSNCDAMIMRSRLHKVKVQLAIVALTLSLVACSSTGVPQGIEPINDFELERYLGTWFEVARLENEFERGLDSVTATYSLKNNGQVHVLNRGWKTSQSEWVAAVGRAKFVKASNVGHLAVSFFGPFFGSYVIFELDDDYEYAWVSGKDRSTLWYLSRSPEVDAESLARFRERAKELGFSQDNIIDVDQTRYQ